MDALCATVERLVRGARRGTAALRSTQLHPTGTPLTPRGHGRARRRPGARPRGAPQRAHARRSRSRGRRFEGGQAAVQNGMSPAFATAPADTWVQLSLTSAYTVPASGL